MLVKGDPIISARSCIFLQFMRRRVAEIELGDPWPSFAATGAVYIYSAHKAAAAAAAAFSFRLIYHFLIRRATLSAK